MIGIFTSYFFQDDFFHFIVSQTDGTWEGFFRLFGVYPFEDRGIAFYRPLSRELPYFLSYQLFGLNPLPFRVFSFLVHVASSFLVYKLGLTLTKNKQASLLATLFFAIGVSNVSKLYYLAGGIQTSMATLFILLFCLSFLEYLKRGKATLKILSFALFIFGIASHEQAVVIPLLGMGLLFLHSKMKRVIPEMWPYFCLTLIYLYIEIVVIGFSSSEEVYHPVISLGSLVNGYGWYSAWALGLPEMLVDFVRPGLSLDPRLMRYWGSYFKLIFPLFFVFLFIFGGVLLKLLMLKRKLLFHKTNIFLAVWFVAVLVPVVFLPFHKSTHYLAPAMPAFWLLCALVLSTVRPKALLFLSLCTLLGLNFTSIYLSSRTHWAVQRAVSAEKLINGIKSEYPTLPKGGTVYIQNDPQYPFISEDWGGTAKQARVILSGGDAMRLLYDDLEIEVVYEDEEPTPPEGAYVYYAKI